MLVDYPVHQLEADEGDGKEDSRVLVDITGGNAEHLVDVLWGDHRLWHESGGGGWGRGARAVVVKAFGEARHRRPVGVVVLGDGVFSATSFAVPRRVVHLKMDSLKI